MKKYILPFGIVLAVIIWGWHLSVAKSAMSGYVLPQSPIGVYVTQETPGVYLLALTEGKGRNVAVKIFDEGGAVVYENAFLVDETMLNILDFSTHGGSSYALEVACGDYVVSQVL